MDVRFCEGRNHRREARVRAAGSARVRRARSSEARLRRIFFSLTKTYMEVGQPEVGNSDRECCSVFENWLLGGVVRLDRVQTIARKFVAEKHKDEPCPERPPKRIKKASRPPNRT